MSYQFKVIEELKNDYLRQSSAFARQLKNAIEILMNMASEETQFLLELIQNADDEKSNWIRLHLTKEAIIFSNNGNPFQYNPDAKTDSVRSICSVGESTKKESGDYIGFFGIGFKSVFRITDSPKIISGGFRFEFNRIRIDDDYPWHIIPHWLDLIPNNLDHSQTHFILPFKVDFGEEYINNLSNTLDYQFESTVLLFLKNIKEIEIINEITEKSQHFRRTLFDVQENLEEIKDLKSGSSSIWKIFDEKYKVPDEVKQDIYTKDYKRRIIDGKEVFPSKVKVIIAFKVDDSKNLIPDSDCLLYSFLPVMQVKTGFKFLFHGDFILTSSRTDFHRQAKWNLWLLSCIADFLTYNTNGNENKKGIIPFFLEHPIWKYQFYSVLPLDGEVTDKILKYIEQPIIEFCKENPVAIN